MYITRVPNRGSPPAVLLRESYREHGKVRTRTLANLSRWPAHKVDRLQCALKGLPTASDLAEAFEITRSLPHGHVAAVLGTAEKLGMAELIDPAPSRNRDLVCAMLAATVIAPASKLATARGLRADTATSSLGQVLGVSGADEDDLYAAMDWVLGRKDTIEDALAARHLATGTLVLYDVSSAAFEGHTCPLGAIGHPRDGVKGRLQIVYGLLCSPAGAPIAIEVFEGNTADPKTLTAHIDKLKTRFGLSNIAVVGDRGMLTSARIRDELRPAHMDWISALRADQIRVLVNDAALQLSLFDEQNLFEITHPDYPGERLVCCHNPALADERARTRHELLAATETQLQTIATATRRAASRCAAKTRSPCGWARCATSSKWPSTFTSTSPMRPSPSPATRTASPPRRPLTASMCYAPACPPRHFSAMRWSYATKTSPTSNASSAPSTPNSTCGRSGIGWPTGCAHTCSYACCPTTSAGT
jgi:hypothetical protein